MRIQKFFIPFLLFVSSIAFAQTTMQHKVVKGETIYAIARKYDITPTVIYKFNPSAEGKTLQINTILLIPKKQVETVTIEGSSPQSHIVQSRESLSKISKKYDISVKELKRLNPSIKKRPPIGTVVLLKKNATVKINDESITSTKIIKKQPPNIKIESAKVDVLINAATQNLGVKYKRGGTGKKGFDCSGLMCIAYKEIDITLPRTSYNQAKIGKKVKPSKAKKGDLIFFATGRSNKINHVGLITEVDKKEIKFIHASLHSGVTISSTKESYYAKRMKQINTIL